MTPAQKQAIYQRKQVRVPKPKPSRPTPRRVMAGAEGGLIDVSRLAELGRLSRL